MEQGALWTQPGRVPSQPQLLPRDTPGAAGINRAEKKIAFQQERREG